MCDKNDNNQYKVVRNDGMVYITIDRDNAFRLVRQLNEKYEGTYTYTAVSVNG